MAITYIGDVLQEDELTPAERVQVGIDPPPLLEQLLADDPAKADAVITLAAGLIDRAGDMWDALAEISEANTAKPFAELITDQVLSAALPLTP